MGRNGETLLQGEGNWLATSSDFIEKDPHIEQCTVCQKTAEETEGGRTRHGAITHGRDGCQLAEEPARSLVTDTDGDISSHDAPRITKVSTPI